MAVPQSKVERENEQALEVERENEQALEVERENEQALEVERENEQALEVERNEMIAELIGRGEIMMTDAKNMQFRTSEEKEGKKAELIHELYSLEKRLAECKALSSQEDFEEIVSLNVGGMVYTTTVDTLRREPGSMLDALFSGRHAVCKDRHGNYFLDRDGETFSYILSYLRTGILPEDMSAMTLRKMKVEGDYYGLDGLLKLLEGGARKSQPQFAVLSYTPGFVPSNFIGQIPEGIELVFFQDDCYRSCKDMTEVLSNMKEKGWSLVLNVPATANSNSKGRLIFSRESHQGITPSPGVGDYPFEA